MMTFLAEATTVSNTDIFLVVCGIASALTAIVVGAYSMTRKSQERIVTISPDAATKHEVEQARVKQSNDVKELHNKIERVQGEINTQIHAMSRDMGVISGQNDLQTGRLAQIDAKLDRLIERKHS